MNRRQMLGLLGAAPLTAVAIPKALESKADGVVNYKGWRCEWSGWIPSQNQHLMVGRWVATHPDYRFLLYSSYPGIPGFMCPTQLLCVGLREDQEAPIPGLTPEKYEEFRNKSLADLFGMIDIGVDPIRRK